MEFKIGDILRNRNFSGNEAGIIGKITDAKFTRGGDVRIKIKLSSTHKRSSMTIFINPSGKARDYRGRPLPGLS